MTFLASGIWEKLWLFFFCLSKLLFKIERKKNAFKITNKKLEKLTNKMLRTSKIITIFQKCSRIDFLVAELLSSSYKMADALWIWNTSQQLIQLWTNSSTLWNEWNERNGLEFISSSFPVLMITNDRCVTSSINRLSTFD